MTNCEKIEQFVCISCVDEVRYSFVSHLSKALRRKGINDVVIDVDSDDLLSKESQAKVEKARVSVMVLPGNSDLSKVWLDKFVKVLECQRNKDQVVVPVLYGDSPLQGEWLSALDLGGLSPIHRSRKECSDAKLVEEIVRDVDEKLFYMGRIGIYSKLLEIENMVCNQPLDIRSVGIWGMPGIGKTTLAKAVFDQMSGEFDAYCFIEDFDKVIHEKGLYRLLEERFLKEKPGAYSNITKFSLLRNKLNNKRVLVVLDDVCNPLLAEPFLGGFDWFGPKSLIIITSRDKQVFRLCGVNQIYEVEGLNEKEALQLFLLCASIKDMREQNLHELSMKVVKHANGHPLALNIYGRELKCKRKLSEMETAFLKFKLRPPFKIFDAFKSSYDTLNDSEKNIFLDIACFFQGENVDYVIHLLEGCGFFPRVGIDVLVEKRLVTVSNNCVRMHNLIQDIGREIINGETVQIERRSRLWEPWSVKYLLEDNGEKENGEHKTTLERSQGTEEIKGMFLDTSNLSFDVKPFAFENMLNLRLLKIYCSNPKIHPVINFPRGSLHSLPNELRLLHWENYPLQSLPQYFDPGNLVEINMPYSQLQTLWGGTENLKMLRTIRLCHSLQLVDIGDLLKAQNLEVIDLQGCTRLQSFPATSQLLHLRVVNLSGCKEIKSFREIPPNIETLHLQGTGIRKLPISPNGEQLVSLSEFKGLSNALILERLTSLDKCSSSSQDLGRLIRLELKDCSRLQSLPNMANLEFLKVLDLSGCSELETIQVFPRNLKELYLAGTAVREVPQLPQSLELLNAHGSHLGSLPDMANLEFLKVLNLSGCSKLKIIQGFPRNLKELYLAGTGLREVPQLPLCLELLNAHGCVSHKSIHLDSEKPPIHYMFSNFFDLSPQVVNDFFVEALTNIKHIPRENPQDLNIAPTFSFSAPSHTNQNATLDLQPGSSVMIRLNPSWRNTLVGFAMLVEVSFSDDYSDVTGLGIRCVCRWKNEEGHSQRIERNLHCWATGEAVPNVQKDHTFVFCDVNMRPSTGEGNDPDISADLVVFEFFPVNQQKKCLNDSCTVTRCGVYVITAATGSPSLKNTSPVLSLDPMEVSGNEVEEVSRVSYDGLPEMDKALFLYIACLFNNEDVDLVAPLIASVDLAFGYEINNLADQSLIHVSSSGQIVMHWLQRKMGKEILRRKSMLPDSSKDFIQDFEMVSVASSSSRNWKYDVFLSFSRQDVRNNLISHLLKALSSKGITTFINNEILSPVFIQAIRESNISIVMFSKDYASSSWNLNELVEITKSREELLQRVITIFYDVDPLDVSKQRGEFGRRFKQTCENKSVDEKRQWCQALTDVANLRGYCSEKWDNEADMMETIASDVSRKLNITASEDFGDIVGIEDHISKINTLLCLESKEVRMVGIWGPSGVGKSTIARAVYSRLACQYPSRIFVDKTFIDKTLKNCRRIKLDDYDTKLHLQTQFLSELLGQRYIELHHLGMVGERLKGQKVFIILDDVDDLVVLETLVGQTRWFGPGSRIILTTEDRRLLMSHGIYNTYEVSLPSKNQALQIFYQYAFRERSPSHDFLELGKEVARFVGNLPLDLKVIGSSLRGTGVAEWMDVVFQISGYQNGETWRILRLAYDRLGDHDKVIFLYIACVFNNYMVEYVAQLLAYHHLNFKIGLASLAEKSFIHISEHGNIGMHCLLQRFGREIVRTMSSHMPASQYLNAGKRVLGISLDKLNFANKEFKLNLPHVPNTMSHRLKLLRWETKSKFNLRPEILVQLTMEANKLENLWNGVPSLGSLKRMSVQGSSNLLEIPDLSLATNLEKLDLGSCSSLTSLPSFIRNIHKLRDLNMKDCIKLEVLPTSTNLEYLYCLNLKGCSQLKSFPVVSRNISDLYLDGTPIEEVPWWIEYISGLSYLSMTGCNKLKKISPNISKLKLLVEVDFSDCTALTEDSWQNHPEEISTSLMKVNMSGTSLMRLPDIWTSIQPKDLIFNTCRKLVSLPELPASLSMLSANDCESLENLSGAYCYSQVALQFINCFKLGHQARELILQSNCTYAILPGGELPAYFTHRPDESSQTISLPQSFLTKKLLSFKACIMVEFRSGWLSFGALWHFRGRNYKQYVDCWTNTSSMRNHLIVFNCEFALDEVNDSPSELNNSDLQFEFFCHDYRNEMIKIKECGIQLLEVSLFAEDGGDRSESEYGNDTEESDAEETRNSKRMRIM